MNLTGLLKKESRRVAKKKMIRDGFRAVGVNNKFEEHQPIDMRGRHSVIPSHGHQQDKIPSNKTYVGRGEELAPERTMFFASGRAS